jgi:hypothetical protein
MNMHGKRILVFTIVLHAIRAHAQPSPELARSEGDDEPRSWAKGVSAAEQAAAFDLYAAGNAEFVEANYAQALAKYKEALDHWDHPAIRYNIAACLLKLGQVLEAKDNFDRSLSYGVSPLGSDMYEAGLQAVKQLEAQLSELTITNPEAGTSVVLDGDRLLAAPGGARQFVLPGTHRVVATRPGFPSLASTIVLGAGTRTGYVLRPTVKLINGNLQPALELEETTTSSGRGSKSAIPHDPGSRDAASEDLPEDPPPSRRWSRVRSASSYSLEVGAGGGLVWVRSEADGIDPITGLPAGSPGASRASHRRSAGSPAFSLGVGFVHPVTDRTDLAVRALLTGFSGGEGVFFATGYVGASVQYWWREHAWIGLGQGLAFTSASYTDDRFPVQERTGIGLDLAIGYAVDADSNFPVQFSLEVIPGVFPGGAGAIMTAALFGIAIP